MTSPTYAPPPPDAPPMGGPDDLELEDLDAQAAEDLAAIKWREKVAEKVRGLHLDRDARARFFAEIAATEPVPPFDAGTLDDILARPDEPAHRVEGLIPANAGTLIVAQRKTGKTTFMLNLARCLLNGEDFLGRFPVTQVTGRIAILNFEVSARQLATWAADAGIPGDRLFLVNLRGRRNPLSNPADREALATKLRSLDVETVIVDPFGRAFTGAQQNDAGEVGAFLTDLDMFVRAEVGARDLVLAAHAGWNGERTRGSTALEDWADSIITMTRDDDGSRYLRAEGRDVFLKEDRLTYNQQTRTLVLDGAGDRKTALKVRQLEPLKEAVRDLLEEHTELSGYKLDEKLKALINSGDLTATHSKGDGARAARLLEKAGKVQMRHGPRNAELYSLTSPTSPHLPTGTSGDLPDLPIGGEVDTGGPDNNHLPIDTAPRSNP